MPADPAPRRLLGGLASISVVVGAIIGVGVFITPSDVAAIAGDPATTLLLWALGGGIAICGALSLAEVGVRFPASGGQIVALHRMFGPLPAFLYGWCLLTAIQTGVLVIITFFAARNLDVLLGAGWDAPSLKLVATGMLLALAFANLRGVRSGAWVQTLTVAAKLLTIAALVALGIGLFFLGSGKEPAGIPLPESFPPSVPLLAGLAAVLFSYGGFHQLTWVGGEVRNPARTLPFSIVAGILIVVAAYLAVNAAYFLLLPFGEVAASKSLATDAVARVLPGIGAQAAALALCVSAFGIANTSLLTAPRVYYALAREGLFPGAFRNLDAKAGVPRAAILLQVLLALALLWWVGPDRMNPLVNGVVFV
ncbi:MAG: APC family permease, partial [Planctomycetota bacterium]